MNLNKQSSVAVGAFLIALGLVWWLHLWALLLPAALLVGGAIGYQQRRQLGRTAEAVQVGMWGAGLALLFLVHSIWPGILFLAGASVLLRGREASVDAYVQNLLAQMRGRRKTMPAQSHYMPLSNSQPAPSAPAVPQPVARDHAVRTGDTTRL